MARAKSRCASVAIVVNVELFILIDVLAFVVEVFETADEGGGENGIDGLNVFNTGEDLAYHHENTKIGANPLCGTNDASMDSEVGEDIGKDEQQDVDDNLLAEFGEELLAGSIFVDEMFPHAEHGVNNNCDRYPLGKFPILIEVLGEVCHDGEWQ